MRDNPSLSPAVLRRYEQLYSGAFRERFVLGRWTAAQGAVYPMFDPLRHVVDSAPACSRYFISCDYGTVNPASFGLWGEAGGVWYRLAEYYHDSRRMGELRTDEEYYAAASKRLAGDRPSRRSSSIRPPRAFSPASGGTADLPPCPPKTMWRTASGW